MRRNFRRSEKYNQEWILAGVGGAANTLWLTEWLCEALELRSGMRVLDLGCGTACSSMFPLRADARDLPFAAEFFDAVISIDSFHYYGADDLFTNYGEMPWKSTMIRL